MVMAGCSNELPEVSEPVSILTTEEEQNLQKKGYGEMKKIMKFVLGFVAATFIIIAVFWGRFVYVSNYKVTEADTSVSPDGTYELVLQAVGEADFSFGSASGRLILYEGKSRISQADFELFDDGRSIRSSIWEVTWHEDYVAVILSGDEQLDEQIILFFDGKKERKQLTDEEPVKVEDVSESGVADSQIVYAGESESWQNINFVEYSGYWSCEGKTHEQILAEGGIELSCTITEDNQFSGTLFSQQEITERFATIEEISGKIEQAELYFDYTDDEWGNSGTLHIQFLSDSIYVEVLNDKNAAHGSDYGINGTFELIREKENITEIGVVVDSGYHSSWTEEEMISAVNERSQYYKASAYYSEIIDYWENVREVRDISNVVELLFETDRKYYTKEEFESEPMLVIHLAKNEIYARHGYIFADVDLYNYFMGCIWYSPTCDGTNFDDSILNEYERANLEILADLDTY